MQDPDADGEDDLSVAEFEAAYVALSSGDRIRLRKLALHFANRCGGEADDLLQEALARVLEGRRHCPREISIVASIGGIVRSLSSEAVETRKKGLGPVSVPDVVVEQAAHDGPSPEREAASRLDGGDMLVRVQEAVGGDQELEMLVEGVYDEMKGVELEELLGVDTKRLATVQRRLQRRITHLKAERVAS